MKKCVKLPKMKHSQKNSKLKLLHTEVRTEKFECTAENKNKDGSLSGLPTKHLHISVFNCS